MEYRTLDSAVVGVDEETDNDDIQYVDIGALSESGDFRPVDCSSKVPFPLSALYFTLGIWNLEFTNIVFALKVVSKCRLCFGNL